MWRNDDGGHTELEGVVREMLIVAGAPLVAAGAEVAKAYRRFPGAVGGVMNSGVDGATARALAIFILYGFRSGNVAAPRLYCSNQSFTSFMDIENYKVR